MFEHRMLSEELARKYAGKIKPSYLNVMYTDKRDIPKEFR